MNDKVSNELLSKFISKCIKQFIDWLLGKTEMLIESQMF